MAPASGRESAAVSERLFHEPYRFDFFQAVRLLEKLALERAGGQAAQQRFAVGQDRPPAQESTSAQPMPAQAAPSLAVASRK